MTDLIRKSDALAVVLLGGSPVGMSNRIAALPAVTPKVKPLAWDRYGNAQGYGCKYMVYEARMGWNAVLYPQDAAHFQIATDAPEAEAVAACDNDHRARILAALEEPVAAPDPADDPECTDCGGTSITHQTERRCACQPAPDPAAIREAALREALKAFEGAVDARCESCGHPRSNHPYRHPFISSENTDPKAAILALIQKGAAE